MFYRSDQSQFMIILYRPSDTGFP